MAGDLVGDGADVLVAAVAGDGDADDALAERLQALDEVDHGADGGLVVAVVEDDAEAVLVEDVHPAGRLEEGVVEGPEAGADLVEREAEGVGHGGGEHGVLDVVQRLALDGGRDQVGPDQRQLAAVVVDHDLVAVEALLEHDGGLAELDVLAHQRVAGRCG